MPAVERGRDEPALQGSAGFSHADEGLANLYARGRTAHLDLDLEFAAFARLFSAAARPDEGAALERIAAEDLFLAYACGAGVAGAAARFEAVCGPSIQRAVARVLSRPKDREEAAQQTRQMLLVGDRPKITSFRGSGPLVRWVSVVALRVAVSTGRAETAERRLRERVIAGATGEADPERQLMEREVRGRIEAALTEALKKLEARDRLVLRLHLVSGMSLTAIAAVLRVNHTTVSRLMRRLCDQLLATVAVGLRDAGAHQDGLSSLLGLLAGRLEISVSRLLAAE
jgi:RNA polymerase sigma-70 factor